ncbi:MAG TPA: regulatory signaling modulator protein AmpE, partial [Erwinia persicina]|nr:regulatory signaling modulator protein AmpE [Erwinia persicina]
MTLFSLLLVLGWERLFKMGEHWQLDHHLMPLFRARRHFSLIRTLLMTVLIMAAVALCLLALKGLFFGVPKLLFWILIGLLCIGAGSVRLHYHAYLKAASHND